MRRVLPPATSSRKKQHVELTVSRDVRFKKKTTGLEQLDFVHNALPEVNLSEIDISTRFLGYALSAPFLVSCMTGGYPDALRINRRLGEICEDLRIPMGVGSQRQALENATYHRSFSVVREVAPSIPVIGNIGAAEVARMESHDAVQRLAELIRADAFTVHLNPLQEFLQPEGSTHFKGVLDGIASLVKALSVPVIVKEIGAGISAVVAQRLLDVGVTIIDVAGAGGTSWAGVETLRSKDRPFALQFWDWGIPTADALSEVSGLRGSGRQFTMVASGGITNGLEAAKCIALGADLVGSARPVLEALTKRNERGVREMFASWSKTLRGVMFLTGSRTIADLQHVVLKRR